jgi:uncharacterized membrane protein YoaK (UPF0700 family)
VLALVLCCINGGFLSAAGFFEPAAIFVQKKAGWYNPH